MPLSYQVSTINYPLLSRLVGRMGIQNIPQTVAQEIEPQDGDKDGDPREDTDPGCREELLPGG